MSSAKQQPLTTTSYALLGLISIRDWTAYELAGQMHRGLGKFWPRARSMLFREPQKLIDHGLAQARQETVGRRGRTVYSITPKGRRALRAWLREPGDPPSLEWEQLVKVFFADAGSKEDLLETLRAITAWVDERLREQRARARSYLDGEGAFQHRAAVLALTGGFLAEFEGLVGDWARRAAAIVEDWPDDLGAAEPDWPTIERIAEIGSRCRAAGARASG